MVLNIILNRYFQIRYESIKSVVHSSDEALSRVLSPVLFTRKELNYFSLFR